MNRKSIIEFCLVPPPYGGVTVYVKRLSDRLRSEGYEVGGYYTEECKDQSIISSPIYFKEKSYCGSHNRVVKAFTQMFRMLKNTFQMWPFSIVHYHGLENLKFIWFLYKYCRKQVVITVHSMMIESFYRRTDRINKHYMQKLAEADIQWTAVSEQARECMLRLPFSFKNEIPVIAAYVPIPNEAQIPLAKDMQDYIHQHEQNIAFYARSFMYNDGVDVYGLNEAIKLYADIVSNYKANVGLIFCLSENKDTDKINGLYLYAKELGIYDKIYWQIGAIDNINELWQNVDVYIRPTSTDGDSVAVREVLDQGTKVVASDVCWRPDGVISYQFGNGDDFLTKTIHALKCGRAKVTPNFNCYNAMKQVFDNITR